MGNSHGTRTSFDASSPSYNFGFRYVQGTGNGPAAGGGSQFYSWYQGLGSDYPATGAGSYGMYIAIPRTATTPYMSVRYNEGNSLGSWIKIAAGFADSATTATTAGALTTGNNYQVNSFGVGTAPSGTTGEIRATNNVTAYYSDERLKENIKTIPSALSKLLTLRGVTFNSNEIAEQYGYFDKKEQVGVIAQDVEKVLPQVVVPAPFDIAQDEDGNEYSKSGENYKTVHYDKLVPLLIEAIKEQSVIIKDMQKQIDKLKSKIST